VQGKVVGESYLLVTREVHGEREAKGERGLVGCADGYLEFLTKLTKKAD